VTLLYPIPYDAGDRLGSALAWRTDLLEMAFSHSDVTVTSDGQRAYINDIQRRFDLWIGAPSYVAFRWKSTGGIWKYGYVLVELSGHGTLKIHGYGMEV